MRIRTYILKLGNLNRLQRKYGSSIGFCNKCGKELQVGKKVISGTSTTKPRLFCSKECLESLWMAVKD